MLALKSYGGSNLVSISEMRIIYNTVFFTNSACLHVAYIIYYTLDNFSNVNVNVCVRKGCVLYLPIPNRMKKIKFSKQVTFMSVQHVTHHP